MKKGIAADKSFRKTFGEKKANSNRSKFSRNFKSQPNWHQRCKSNPISMRDEVKAQPNWHSEVSTGKLKNDEKNWQLRISLDEK